MNKLRQIKEQTGATRGELARFFGVTPKTIDWALYTENPKKTYQQSSLEQVRAAIEEMRNPPVIHVRLPAMEQVNAAYKLFTRGTKP